MLNHVESMFTNSKRDVDAFNAEIVVADHRALTNELHMVALSHWLAVVEETGCAVPARADIRLEALKRVLPFTLLMEPTAGNKDFRYRVYGTALVEATGKDKTGTTVSEGAGSAAAFLIELYRQSIEKQRPLLTVHPVGADVLFATWERLALPICRSGDQADEVLCVACPTDWAKAPPQYLTPHLR